VSKGLGCSELPRVTGMSEQPEQRELREAPYEYEARFLQGDNPTSVFVRTQRPLVDPEEAPAGASYEIEYDGWRFRILRVVEDAEPATESELQKIGELEVELLRQPPPPS
jgi:hypothetical protein